VKTTKQIFVKILPQMYLGTRKNRLHFGNRPLLDHEEPKLRNINDRIAAIKKRPRPFVYLQLSCTAAAARRPTALWSYL